jgi:fibrillarin-like pre-rRNA processing protein
MNNLRVVAKGDQRRLATKNLVPGKDVYGEETLIIDTEEYRVWDPHRSKLAAGLLKGLPPTVVNEGDRVLYLGTSTGTTASHVSDIIGSKGILIGVEFAPRVAREFIEKVAKRRENVIPFVADARNPAKYLQVGRVDLVYCDIAQPDQTKIAIENCGLHLRRGGILLLIVKSRSIDVLRDPSEVFQEEAGKLRDAGFRVEKIIDLKPYDRDHALIEAIFT